VGQNVVILDGRRCEPGQERISVFDRGFLYGDAVFETLRTYGGRLFRLEAHLARLREGAARVFIDVPWPDALLQEEAEQAVAVGGFAESYLRVMVTRGEAGFGLAPDPSAIPRRLMLVRELAPPSVTFYATGARAVSYRAVRYTEAADLGVKISNYLIAVLAQRKAQQDNAQEALIVGPDGLVREGASSNLFWVERGQLFTPAAEGGVLAGITRAEVLRCAAESGLAVNLANASPGSLVCTDGVFVTSTLRELLPIVCLDGVSIGAGKPGPVWRKLWSCFRGHTGHVVAP
jgi:branched-chain amino acid aminotransferase